MPIRRLIALAAIAALAACNSSPTHHVADAGDAGGDAGGQADDGGDGGQTSGPSCTPASDLIAAGFACYADDNCPCGAHCSLGRCSADCQTAIDCDGGSCDLFGRCRALADTTPIANLDPVTQGVAILRPTAISLLDFGDAGSAGSFTLTSAARQMRLAAQEGLALTCPAADDAGSEDDGGFDCWYGPRDAGTLVQFSVSATLAFDGGETRDVTLYIDNQVQAFGVTSQEALVIPAPSPLPAAGTYSGTASLLDQGLWTDEDAGVPPSNSDGDGGDILTSPPATLLLPIHAEVVSTAGGLLLELVDQSQLIGSAGQWIGTLQAAGDGGVLTLPDYRLISDTLVARSDGGADIEVLMHAEPATVNMGAGGASFSFELDVSATGILGAGGPASRFHVTLSAVPADSGSDAGLSAQQAYIPELSATRAADPTGWESVASADMKIPFAAGSQNLATVENTLLTYWQLDGGPAIDGGVRLDACDRSDADLLSLQNAAFFEAMLTPALVRSSQITPGSSELDIANGIGGSYQTYSTSNGPLGAVAASTFQLITGINLLEITSYSGVAFEIYGPNDGGLGLDPRAIPCAIPAVSVNLAADATVSLSGSTFQKSFGGVGSGSIDVCDTLAATYGCILEPVPPSVSPELNATALLQGSGFLGFVGSLNFVAQETLQGAVTKVCVLPSNPAICPQAWDCAIPTADTVQGIDSSLLTPTTRANSGDLVCGAGSHSEAIAFDENNEPATSGALSASQLFTACLNELSGFATTPPPPAGTAGASSVQALLARSPQCVDVQRLLLSLGSGYPEFGPPSTAVQALAQRTFQRWIKLHTFLAQEAIEQEPVGQFLRETGASTAPPGLTTSLQIALSGWDLLLHPRFAAILAQIGGAQLAQPDYRTVLFPGQVSKAGTDQSGGVPAAILQGLDTTLRLAQVALKEAWSTNKTDEIPQLTEVLRDALVLRPLAYDLAARAQASAALSGVEIPWLPDYQASDASLAADMQAFQQQLAAFLAGKNALGIEDTDLPLYFLGDQVGPGGQFAAVSDYLLGSGPGSNAWAPALVAQATSDLTAAQAAYVQQQDRMLAQQEAASAETNREEALKTQYGTQILNLCGSFANVPADQILDQAGDLDGHSCYYSSDPSCHVSDQAFGQLVAPDDIAYQLCVIGMLKVTLDPSVGFADPNLDGFAKGIAQNVAAEASNLEANIVQVAQKTEDQLIQVAENLGSCPGENFAAYCVTKRTPSPMPDQAEVHANSFQTVTGLDTTNLTGSDIGILLGTATARTGAMQTAQQICQLAVPAAHTHLPSIAELNPNLTDGTCYQGSLGQLALSVQSSSQSLQLANTQFSDTQSAYAAASQSCITLQQQLMQSEQKSLSAIQTALATTAQQVETIQGQLSSIKGKLGFLLDAAQSDCTSGPGLSTLPPGLAGLFRAQLAVAGVGAQVQCQLAKEQQALIFGTLPQALSAAQGQQQALSTQLQTLTAQLTASDAATLQACADNVAQYFIALQNATTEVQQASNATLNAKYALENQAEQVELLLAEGRQSLSVMRGHAVVPPDADYWLKPDIQTFQRDFQLAQLATYLAVRAVEYEYQISLSDRTTTLAAQSPSDLSGVLQDLYLAAGSRQINGASPSDLEVVISLRDQLLQLSDQSALPAGWHRLTPAQRFQLLLSSPKYAVYDATSNYLGQEIPFSLVPEGTLKIGNAHGISVLAGADCAERLWNVNASVLGTEPLLQGNQNQVFTNIDLLKSNTFYSQWCGKAPSGGSPFQTESVDPTRNLFEIPALGATVGSNFGVTSKETQFTTARIQAFFNVDAATFEAAAYDNGSTQELAARGLFGDYALFLPASTLSQTTPAGQTNGLILNNVSDILLRLDYVSVANGP